MEVRPFLRNIFLRRRYYHLKTHIKTQANGQLLGTAYTSASNPSHPTPHNSRFCFFVLFCFAVYTPNQMKQTAPLSFSLLSHWHPADLRGSRFMRFFFFFQKKTFFPFSKKNSIPHFFFFFTSRPLSLSSSPPPPPPQGVTQNKTTPKNLHEITEKNPFSFLFSHHPPPSWGVFMSRKVRTRSTLDFFCFPCISLQ